MQNDHFPETHGQGQGASPPPKRRKRLVRELTLVLTGALVASVILAGLAFSRSDQPSSQGQANRGAGAQAIIGQVSAITDTELTLKTPLNDLKVTLTDQTKINKLVAASHDDLETGKYVAVHPDHSSLPSNHTPGSGPPSEVTAQSVTIDVPKPPTPKPGQSMPGAGGGSQQPQGLQGNAPGNNHNQSAMPALPTNP